MIDNDLYSRPVLDFITVSAEFCKLLEHATEETCEDFVQTLRRLIPMVYLKAVMLDEAPDVEGYNMQHLTEEDYDYIRSSVHAHLGVNDEYLDTFSEDFRYSDQPVLRTISEDLADTYQVLREMVEAFRTEDDECMAVALRDTLEDFEDRWGQSLLGALRALHAAAGEMASR